MTFWYNCSSSASRSGSASLAEPARSSRECVERSFKRLIAPRSFTREVDPMKQQASDKNNIIRLPEVRQRTGLSRSSIYAMQAAQTFPRAIKLGRRSVGWVESEVQNFIDERIAQSRSEGVKAAA